MNTTIKTEEKNNLKIYNIESKSFNTLKESKELMKEMKNQISLLHGVSRDDIRIPHGLIQLRGYSNQLNCYINLTSTVYDFNKYIKNENFKDFKLHARFTLDK